MKKEINTILGDRIKEQRKLKGYTREALAEKLSVSTRFLADVESGQVGVSISTLKNISVILDTPTDYLIGITELNTENLLRQSAINKIKKIDEKYLQQINTILDSILDITNS